jgi:hypothetical protein
MVLDPRGTQPGRHGNSPSMTPGSMGEGSPYQLGLPWMYQPVEAWPVRKDFTPPPVEECRKDVTQATCAVARVMGGKLTYPSRATSRAKLVRIFGYVMMAAAAFKKQAGRVTLTRAKVPGGKWFPDLPRDVIWKPPWTT